MKLTRDSISWAFAILGLILPAFSLTFVLDDFTLFATTMFIWGFGMAGFIMMYTMGKKTEDDPSFSEEEVGKVSRYTLLALLVFAGATLFYPRAFTSMIPLTLSVNDKILLAAVFAINEETFFRGGFLIAIYTKLPIKILCSAISGLFFYLFHLNVYGTQPDALFFVAVAGVILGYVVLETRRTSPAYLAHLINNLMSVIS